MIKRPIIVTKNIPDPNWITGFVSGEGNFDVRVSRSTNKIGHRVQLRFRVTQHERDTKLMELLINFFNSGKIYKYPKQPAVSFTVLNITDITQTIIPFFEKYPLLGIKHYDYLDWCKIAKLMQNGDHLTIEGLDLICNIKAGMNRGRKLDEKKSENLI